MMVILGLYSIWRSGTNVRHVDPTLISGVLNFIAQMKAVSVARSPAPEWTSAFGDVLHANRL